jgi:hypothetical protein
MGWCAHYSIGIAFAALLLAVFSLEWARLPTLGPALLVGIVTVAAPLFDAPPASCCEVVAFTETDAHRVGALLGKAKTKDVVDGSVVALAIQRRADIISDDADDIVRLLRGADSPLSDVRGLRR